MESLKILRSLHVEDKDTMVSFTCATMYSAAERQKMMEFFKGKGKCALTAINIQHAPRILEVLILTSMLPEHLKTMFGEHEECARIYFCVTCFDFESFDVTVAVIHSKMCPGDSDVSSGISRRCNQTPAKKKTHEDVLEEATQTLIENLSPVRRKRKQSTELHLPGIDPVTGNNILIGKPRRRITGEQLTSTTSRISNVGVTATVVKATSVSPVSQFPAKGFRKACRNCGAMKHIRAKVCGSCNMEAPPSKAKRYDASFLLLKHAKKSNTRMRDQLRKVMYQLRAVHSFDVAVMLHSPVEVKGQHRHTFQYMQTPGSAENFKDSRSWSNVKTSWETFCRLNGEPILKDSSCVVTSDGKPIE